MSTSARGRVSLVGGGPGDPGLLTVRAVELLRTADVVAYDALVPAALVEMAGPDAELLAVGRRAHGPSSCEYRLHPDVLVRVRAGKHVVRLKAGDPFLFGRGGEEAEELVEAGIPFEIVPGVSAAFGAAACAGIPLTHRDFASDVVIATGHDLEGGRPSKSSWAHLGASRGTVVLYMATRKLAANLARLVAEGRAASTPAAYVASASTGDQKVIVATLGTLAAAAEGLDRAAPAVVIVGEVVALRARLAWLELRPLFGRRVLVARARSGPSSLAASLRALGASVWEAPLLEALPAASTAALDAAIGGAASYAGLSFASADAVSGWARRLGELDVDVRDLPRVPLFAVGLEAGERLRAIGLRAEVVAPGACASALAPLLHAAKGGRLALLGAEDGRVALASELRAAGVDFDYVGAYRTHARLPRVAMPAPEVIVLPSSTAARLLLGSALGEGVRGCAMVAMGDRTAEAARALGATRVRRAVDDSREALLRATRDALSDPARQSSPRPPRSESEHV